MTFRDDLYTWFSDQPAWQQDLAKRLVSRTRLDGDAYEEALRVIKASFGALPDDKSAPEPQTLELADLPVASRAGTEPRLVGFGRLQGVGAAAPDQQLSFAPEGLTVIYGANAAGKSTYVRGLTPSVQ
jgi:hypothetical protein